MNRSKNLLAVFAFSLIILALPSFASAQWRSNGGYGRPGSYNNGNVMSAVQRLRDDSREFARRLDRALDHSRLNGSNREDDINRLASDFRNAADRLEGSLNYGRGDMRSSSDEARRVLQLGDQLDRVIGRARVSYDIQGDWSPIRQELRMIADAYGYNYGRNDNYGRGGGRPYPNNRPF